jgi:RNA polymerase sigma-70 factor (ECF subfamily)
MPSRDDPELVKEVLAGEVETYRLLVERYQKPIYNLMYRMTGSVEDARDLSQEAFIKAYEKLRTFSPDKRFFTWLYTVGYNLAKNHKRRSKTVLADVETLLEQGMANCDITYQENRLSEKLDSLRVHRALDMLPTDYREAIILHYHEELTFREVAMALNLSVSGAKMRVQRGLEKLRGLLLKGDNSKTTGLCDEAGSP